MPRELVEVRRRLAADRVGVEVEQKTRRERDLDPFADALDAGARHGLLELPRTLVHLPADDGAGGPADDGADDRAARRRAVRVADEPAEHGPAGRADPGASRGAARGRATRRGEDEQRADGQPRHDRPELHSHDETLMHGKDTK